VKKKEKEKEAHFLFLRRSGIAARATMRAGPQMLCPPLEVVLVPEVVLAGVPVISLGLFPSTISSVHCSSHFL